VGKKDGSRQGVFDGRERKLIFVRTQKEAKKKGGGVGNNRAAHVRSTEAGEEESQEQGLLTKQNRGQMHHEIYTEG